MKHISVVLAALVMLGCAKKEHEKLITPNEAANKLYVDAVQLITFAQDKDVELAIQDYQKGLAKISKILSDHGESDLAVRLVSGEALLTGKSLSEIKDRVAELERQKETEDFWQQYEATEEATEKFLAGKISVQEMQELKELNFSGKENTTDVYLRDLDKCKNLEKLNLDSTQITDITLEGVAKLPKLKELHLSFVKITDAGLNEVAKCKGLEKLVLRGTKITDEGLKGLAKLHELTYLLLDIPYPQTTDVTLAMVVSKLQRLTYLEVGHEVTDTVLKEVAKLRGLKSLSLNGIITDAGLKELSKLKILEVLGLNSNQITNAGLYELTKLQKLESLGIFSEKITDEGVSIVLAAFSQRLKGLHIGGNQITNAGLNLSTECKRLETLTLVDTPITDAGLKEVAKLKQLKILTLERTKVTKAGLAELQKALPNCRIYGP